MQVPLQFPEVGQLQLADPQVTDVGLTLQTVPVKLSVTSKVPELMVRPSLELPLIPMADVVRVVTSIRLVPPAFATTRRMLEFVKLKVLAPVRVMVCPKPVGTETE